MKNILVVNVNWVGDVIFSTPVFKALKKKYPGSQISCMAVPRVREVLECCPDVDDIITFDEKGKHWTPWGKVALVNQLKSKKFDAAFLLHRAWTRAMLVWLAGIPIRVGYDAKGRGGFLTHRLTCPDEWPHRSDHYLNVIEQYGVAIHDRNCELSFGDEERIKVDDLLKAEGVSEKERFVIINTGGNWDLKRWPPERFAILIRRLSEEAGLKVVIPGAPKDVEQAESIAKDSGVNPVVLAGKTDLKELLALTARADCVVSNDSGPIHLAASVGTPVVGIFGPTRPEITAPRGKGTVKILQHDVGCNRGPCYFLDCPDNVCMKTVSVEEVLAAVLRPEEYR